LYFLLLKHETNSPSAFPLALITHSLIPPQLPFFLSSSFFQGLVPPRQHLYPHLHLPFPPRRRAFETHDTGGREHAPSHARAREHTHTHTPAHWKHTSTE